MLKIKNPWKDKQEWTGKYNKHDTIFWSKSTEKYTSTLKDNEFYMSVDDFKDTFKYFTVTYFQSDMLNSFIEKRNAVNKKIYKFNF
jgi:hypothetical protein